jgi:hypothetical protein
MSVPTDEAGLGKLVARPSGHQATVVVCTRRAASGTAVV